MKYLFIAFWSLLFAVTTACAQQNYKIKPGDTISIEVLEDTSLNRSLLVLPDGTVNFPFAGSVAASGSTTGELQRAIVSGIASNFATTPTVFVTVSSLAPRLAPTTTTAPPTIDVFFVGEVNQPGLVEVKKGTSLLQAVAISGGVSRFAAIKRIQLRRTGTDGVQRVTILNYKALADGAITNDIELKDGDVILVPERRLFE